MLGRSLRCALLSVACASPALAQAPSPGPQPFSITVSGGVSLGAYEAGVLYFLTEAIKRSQGEAELRIATGASAGSANALISLLDSCRAPVEDPARSLGFQTWLPVGMNELFVPELVTASSVFTRAPLVVAMERVAQRYGEGLRADCDVVLGVSVTRETPTHVAFRNSATQSALEIPRQVETFAVRIQGRGPGRVPRLTNYADPRARLPQPLLPFELAEDDAAQMRNFGRLTELLYASSAFPLVFAPYKLAHCETDPTAPDPPATAAHLACTNPTHTRFIDGGLFDNSPLRMNYSLVAQRMRRGADGRTRWLDTAPDAGTQAPAVRFSYVDPSTHAYPPTDEVEAAGAVESALDMSVRLTSTFIETARRRELLALLEESSDADALGERIALTRNQLPTISSQLGAFFGFFERDFRQLDFYLGMYDGLVSVRSYLGRTGAGAEESERRLAAQFPVLRLPLAPDLPDGLHAFACLLSQVEERYAGHAVSCDREELRNFRILLQVTLDRLHNACTRTPENESSAALSPLCRAAAHGGARRSVRGVVDLPEAQRVPLAGETDFAYTLRSLADYGFAFRDLGLSAGESERGAIRDPAQAARDVGCARSGAADRARPLPGRVRGARSRQSNRVRAAEELAVRERRNRARGRREPVAAALGRELGALEHRAADQSLGDARHAQTPDDGVLGACRA